MNRTLLAASAGLVLACAIAPAMGQPVGPAADYKIDAEYTATSPDGTTTIEQYKRADSDDDLTWQFWARHQNEMTMLQPEQPDYPAGFRFTNDSQWVARMQKTGSGEQSLYLYKLGPQGFVAATAKPLDDLAWAYFKSRPDSRKVPKPDFHMVAGLVKGVDDNYHWMGENWPDSRYLVISLSGSVSPNSRHGQIDALNGWHCRYDLKPASSMCRRILPRTMQKRLCRSAVEGARAKLRERRRPCQPSHPRGSYPRPSRRS